MTEEQAWRLFFATGLPEAWLLTREKRQEDPLQREQTREKPPIHRP